MSRRPQTAEEHDREVEYFAVQLGENPQAKAAEIIAWMREVNIDPAETNFPTIAENAWQGSTATLVRVNRTTDAVMFKLMYSDIIRPRIYPRRPR